MHPEHSFLRSPKLSLCQRMRCWIMSLLDPCRLLGLLLLPCGTDSRPSMGRLTARRMSCGSGLVNTTPGRNNNFVNDSGLKLVRMSSFRVQGLMKARFWMLQTNLKIRWKLNDMKSRTSRQGHGASRVVWARVEMRLIFAVQLCEKRLRSKSTSVSSYSFFEGGCSAGQARCGGGRCESSKSSTTTKLGYCRRTSSKHMYEQESYKERWV